MIRTQVTTRKMSRARRRAKRTNRSQKRPTRPTTTNIRFVFAANFGRITVGVKRVPWALPRRKLCCICVRSVGLGWVVLGAVS